MKTFLDTHKGKSKTFIVYGNINDSIWCPDLAVRNFEQYLLKLLKSRGYQHVIFYGQAGTKGAYCLDPESSRFFFSENQGIGLPEAVEITEEFLNGRRGDTPNGTDSFGSRLRESASASRAGQETSVRSLMGRSRRRRGYQPGNLSEETASGDLSVQSPTPENPGQSAPAMIRYAHRGRELSEFLTEISPKMLDPSSHMAVVFYDVFTNRLGDFSSLRDCILSVWEQRSDADNICLMLAPETLYDTTAIVQYITEIGLQTKFAYRETGSGAMTLNPNNCFKIGLPNEDEVKNLLRRLAIAGTGRKHRKISFSYGELDDIAEEILFYSRSHQLGSDVPVELTSEYMKEIRNRVEQYVENYPGRKERVNLRPDNIHLIWNRPYTDRRSALEKINRSGWEKVFQLLKDLTEQTEGALRVRQQGEEAPQKLADWVIGRLAVMEEGKEDTRPPVPNFVLLGDPGVGKTTIARLIGELLRELGILKIGHTVEVTRENLTSSYVAGVPKATMACVNQADEGVLFIDEAHALGRKDGGAEHEGTGKEVVSTLNAVMTSPNRHFSVILAGYQEAMNEVFKLDDGFRSRFGDNVVVIEDYKPELLLKILTDAVRERNCTLDPGLLESEGEKKAPLLCMLERLYRERDRRRFGNAREMAALADKVSARAVNGVVKEECFYSEKISAEWFEEEEANGSLDKILEELRTNFVGMENIRTRLENLYLEIEEKLKLGMSVDDVRLKPIILVGNSGTGKTSVANLLAKMYFHLQLLGTPIPDTLNASQTADRYSGGSQRIILEHVKEAQDKKAMLFVDEAHQFCDPGFDGRGAFRACMAPLTDSDHPFLAVFAVYPNELDAFEKLDNGGKSRFEKICLNDYTGEELFEIIKRMVERQKCFMTQETERQLKRVCEYLYFVRTERSGNARQMENLLKDMDNNRRRRCRSQRIEMGTRESLCFLPEDIPQNLLEKLPPEREDPETVYEQIIEEMDEKVVGLEEVKEYLREVTDRVIEYKERELPLSEIPLNPLILSGNPGVGKTMAGTLVAKLLFRLHVINSSEMIYVQGSDLLGKYKNETSEKTNGLIQKAREEGKILFVDEAHQLCGSDVTGEEAIRCFMAPMTDGGRPFRAVFAVYEDKLGELLRLDPGFTRRARVFRMKDYTGSELFRILTVMAKKRGLQLEKETVPILEAHCENLYETRTGSSGNAGQLERLLDEMDRQRMKRCRLGGIKRTSPEGRRLTREDIPEHISRNIPGRNKELEIRRLEEIRARMRADRVGGEEVKNIISEKIDALKFNLLYPSRAKRVEPGHYFFKGNAGTGKTTGAVYLTKYFYEIGLIKEESAMMLSVSDLIGRYLGETGEKTKNRLMDGLNHVMLIDEAYMLADRGSHTNSYKQDALTELVNFLDNEGMRKISCVIFSGYDGDMDVLYGENQGLKSRIREIAFPDFTHEQSLKVLYDMAERDGYSVDEEVKQLLSELLGALEKRKDFANGRTVRRVYELLCRTVYRRCLEAEYQEEDERTERIMASDVPGVEEALGFVNM